MNQSKAKWLVARRHVIDFRIIAAAVDDELGWHPSRLGWRQKTSTKGKENVCRLSAYCADISRDGTCSHLKDGLQPPSLATFERFKRNHISHLEGIMSRAGVIATITSILRSSRTPPTSDLSPGYSDSYDEEAGLVRNEASSSSPRNHPPAGYGTLPLGSQQHTTETGTAATAYHGSSTAGPRPCHGDHDDALDGNDAAVWKDVQTQGLDGRGSIAETDEDGDFGVMLDGYEANQAMLKDGALPYGRHQ
jgi:hypothetical protein